LSEKKQPILEIKNLTKQFEMKDGRKLTAVNNVSLKLYKGKCLGIVGESGCGKSTLANMIVHLEKPTSGSIIYDNEDISNLKGEKLRQNRKKLQMIFQDVSESFNPRMKVWKIISEPLLNFKLIDKNSAYKEAKKLLSIVGMSENFADRYPHQLSGGQRQRVAIATSLSLKPEIIICDEVTSALDVSIQKQVLSLLVNLQKENELSYIFIGHDLAVVKNISHRIAVMYLGQIVELINSCNLTTSACHPYTKALLSSVFSVKKSNNTKIEIIKGDPPRPSCIPPGCSFSSRCKKCMDICFKEKPSLKEIEKNHLVACHLFDE